MFDKVGFEEIGQALADPATPAIMKLRAAIQLGRIAEAAEARVVADLAVTNGWDKEDETFTYEADVTGRCLVRVGLDGVLMDEALPLEIAAAKHCSVGAATNLIRDLVDLKTRHPFTWQAIGELKAPVWQARQVAEVCGRFSSAGPRDRRPDRARLGQDRAHTFHPSGESRDHDRRTRRGPTESAPGRSGPVLPQTRHGRPRDEPHSGVS